MLDGRQKQVARALARRRFEAAAELDEADRMLRGDQWTEGEMVRFTSGPKQEIGGWNTLPPAETLQPQDELAPRGGFDWPVVLVGALVLVVSAGTAGVLLL